VPDVARLARNLRLVAIATLDFTGFREAQETNNFIGKGCRRKFHRGSTDSPPFFAKNSAGTTKDCSGVNVAFCYLKPPLLLPS
jgi:hypothetical protein